MIEILLADDHTLFRKGLRRVLETERDIKIIGEAGDGDEALQKIDSLGPDIIFMDIKLPGENGLQVTKKVKTKYPEMTIIILTYYDSPEHHMIMGVSGDVISNFLQASQNLADVASAATSAPTPKGP